MDVRPTRKALANLDEEATFIAKQNPEAAAQIVERIETAVRKLVSHPALGQPGRVPGTRELAISGTPYIIPYRVRGKALEILRVLSSSRKWPNHSNPRALAQDS
jgi:addiction module RelE/StbE family toxin